MYFKDYTLLVQLFLDSKAVAKYFKLLLVSTCEVLTLVLH